MKYSLLILTLSFSLNAADAPGWFKEATTASLPEYPAKTPAAVLLQEETVTIEPTGKQTRTTRYVIKILNRDGIREARFADLYFSDTGKPKDFKAWLISPSGTTKEYSKSDVQDQSFAGGLYDEYRGRVIDARQAADPGSFLGVESTIEQNHVFGQFQYDFQDDLPAVRSSFVLNLPPGWSANGKVFYGSEVRPLEPQISGNSYHWQLTKLAPWEREPWSPRRPITRPRLAVDLIPAADSLTKLEHFSSWKKVSVWKEQLTEKSAVVTPEITTYVQQIAPGNLPEAVRIQALAEAAQKIRYISVQMNLSRGGGYTPHTAEFVHRKKYGDCKDKSNYLRTLLKAAGFDSYMVSIHSGDPDFARPEWPSPFQFNHAILAIRVSDQFKAPAAFDYPGIGRLVLFDPTDEDVTFGYIPDHEQGAFALLVAAQHGDLFQTPKTSAIENQLERKTKFTISPDGGMKADVQEVFVGQTAFDARYRLRSQSADEYRKSRERYISYFVPGAALENLEQQDSKNQFRSSFSFSAKTYARSLQNRLMMIRPLPLPIAGLPDVSNPKRTQPFVIPASSFQEEVILTLPEGFEIDEIPEYPEIIANFGKYKITMKPDGDRIVIQRVLEMEALTIPADRYIQFRDFIAKVGGSEKNPIVLVKNSGGLNSSTIQ